MSITNIFDRELTSLVYRRINRILSEAGWYLSFKRWQSVKRMRTLKDKYHGKRCFIIGNGPSLNRMDISCLRNEVTFGLNRIYLLFDKLGFTTSYYVAVNRLVIEQCAKEIERLPIPKFISWRGHNLISFTDDVMFIRSYGETQFSTDITRNIWEGATVTYVAMQIAYYLGFSQVILIGVDHSFQTKGKPHSTVLSKGNDPNHFDPNYFGRGFRWQLPSLENSEVAYRLAKHVFNSNRREILDATVDGKLQVFPKIRFESLFG